MVSSSSHLLLSLLVVLAVPCSGARLNTQMLSNNSYAPCGKAAWKDAPVIALLSGIGEGKSTVCNALARDTWLTKVADDTNLWGETSQACIFKAHWFVGDGGKYERTSSNQVTLVDTPGFYDRDSEHHSAAIADTLKSVETMDVVIWPLNANNRRVTSARMVTLKFLRSYFGNQIYKHLIFVYTRFNWKKRMRRSVESGEKRSQKLTEMHQDIVTVLLREVESQFWPDGSISDEVTNLLRATPYYGINLYDEDFDGQRLFVDGDMQEDEYDSDSPDGNDGVFDTEKSFKPNSATQLVAIKDKVTEIWRNEDQLDTRDLQPLIGKKP